MRDNTGIAWRLLEARDVDDKAGNGFTVVIRKIADRQDPSAEASTRIRGDPITL